jgi:hypothetical protein
MCTLIFFKQCMIVLASIIPRLTSNILERLRYTIVFNFLLIMPWPFIAHKYLASNNPHTSDEGYYYAYDKYGKVTHLNKFPRERILGTHNPTNSACCLLRSLSPANHSVTLNTKLANAATRK